jgi:hypothetical protein
MLMDGLENHAKLIHSGLTIASIRTVSTVKGILPLKQQRKLVLPRLPTIGHLAKKQSELTQDSVAMVPRVLPGFFFFFFFLDGKWW